MAVSDYTLDLLRKFEGYTAKPKWDHKQYSVGYSTRWEPGQSIGTREDHERALSREAGSVDSYLDKNVTVPLTDNQRAALTSFGFNLGPGAIGRLLPDINSGNWDRVANRMLSFSRAGDNPNALIDRRREEAGILTGQPIAASAASSPSPASSTSQPSAKSPQEGNVLEFLQALGGSGNLMGSLGKALGSETMGNMAGSNNIFGSLSAMFGGQGGGESGVGQGGNAVGDQNMQLAQQGMKAAGSQEESIPTYQRKPVDLANLAKILQQRAALGAGPRQGQSGLGA